MIRVNVYSIQARRTRLLLFACLAFTFLISYAEFFRSIWIVWFNETEFSYGALIPLLVAYLIWLRRKSLPKIERVGWPPAILAVIAGCGVQILANRSGTLVLSGISLSIVLAASAGFLWGKAFLRFVAAPLSMIVLMAPVPPYLADDITWRLQAAASASSAMVLRILGVPVYQDGNLLRLTNYVLEVKQACSGSRSFFALVVLALVLAFTTEKKWWLRFMLICAAPLLSLGANLFRIVGTGLIAYRWGNLAANESLHWVWGILIFMTAVLELLGFQKCLQWIAKEKTS